MDFYDFSDFSNLFHQLNEKYSKIDWDCKKHFDSLKHGAIRRTNEKYGFKWIGATSEGLNFYLQIFYVRSTELF